MTRLFCPCCGDVAHEFYCRSNNYDLFQCVKCSNLRLNPLPTVATLSLHYQERAVKGNYEPDKAIERMETLRRILDMILKVSLAGPKGKYFDIGCYDGALLDFAQEAGFETYGLEMQGAAAQRAFEKHEGRIYFSTVEEFAPQCTDFQVISAIGVIEHLLNPLRLLELAGQVLVKDGLLLLQTPDAGSMPAKIMGRHWPCIAAPEHIFYYNSKSLTKALSEHGFDRIKAFPHFKPLRVGYVIDQLQYWGTSIYNAFKPLLLHVPESLRKVQLPFYGGEMIVTARKA